MTFFALVIALLLEQIRPVSDDNRIRQFFYRWLKKHHAQYQAKGVEACDRRSLRTWLMAVFFPFVLVALVYQGLAYFSVLLAGLYFCAVVYLSIGFRQFSHHFNAVKKALQDGRSDDALFALQAWQPQAQDLEGSWLCLIRVSVLEVQHHVLGVIAALVIGALLGFGPAGAVLYRWSLAFLTLIRQDKIKASEPALQTHQALLQKAEKAWKIINYLPNRLTLVAFAVVGRFDDVMSVWREYAHRAQPIEHDAILLDAASVVLGVRLQEPPSSPEDDLLAGALFSDIQEAHMDVWIALAWRSVLLWIFLLGLIQISSWF